MATDRTVEALYLPANESIPTTETTGRSWKRIAVLWFEQLRCLLWLHSVQRSRRKFHTIIEVLSPSFVFLVLLYGVLGSPEVDIPSFIQTTTSVFNEFTAKSPALSPQAQGFAGAVAQSSAYVPDESAERRHFDVTILPELLADASPLAAQIASSVTSNTDSALPVVVPHFDQLLATFDAAATAIGRSGNKKAQFISAAVWAYLHRGKIAVAPDTPAVRQLLAYFAATTSSFGSLFFPQPYPSVEAALSANAQVNGAVLAAVEFINLDPLHGKLEYVIRMNQTLVPKTSQVVDPFPQGLGADFAMYLQSGFASMQFEFNEYFTRLAAAHSVLLGNSGVESPNSGYDSLLGLCGTAFGAVSGNFTLGAAMFPVPSGTNAAINNAIAAQPASPTIVVSRPQLAAVQSPCDLEIVTNCSGAMAVSNDDVLQCLEGLVAHSAAGQVCAALVGALTANGPCVADMNAAGFLTAAGAIGGAGNASKFPAMVALTNASNLTPACAASAWGALVQQTAAASDPCGPDLRRICTSASNDNERLDCLTRAASPGPGAAGPVLSPLCAAVVATLTPSVNGCADDFATVCPYNGLTENFPLFCLAANAPVLSATCYYSPLFAFANLLTARVAVRVDVPAAVSTCIAANGISKSFHRGMAAAAFPAPGYAQSQFYKTTGTLFGLVAAMAFVFQFTSLARFLVQDRELKHKTLLLAVGVPRSVIFAANFLVGTVSCVVSSFFAMFLLLAVTPGVHLSVTYGLLFLYSWSLANLALLVSRFCNLTRTASTIAPLILFALAMPAFVVVGKATVWDILFSPSVIVSAFNEIALISQSSEPLANITSSLRGAQLVLMGQSFVYLLLAWLVESAAASVRHGIIAHGLRLLWSCRDRTAGGTGNIDAQEDAESKEQGAPVPRHIRRISGGVVDEELRSIPRQSQRSLAADATDGDSFSETASIASSGVAANPAVEFDGVRLQGWPGALLPRLRDVSFTCKPGKITALIGPTGSGKSSVLDVLFDVTEAAGGAVKLFGQGLYAFDRHDLGACLQRNVVWEALTVREHVDFMHSMKGDTYASEQERTKSITSELEELDLLEEQHVRASKISRGTARRMAVAMAFAGRDTTVVALDSPTEGVDEHGKVKIAAFVDARKASRSVIIATSHFGDAEAADHVVVLDRGSVIKSGNPSDVQGQRKYCLAFDLAATVDMRSFVTSLTRALPSAVVVDNWFGQRLTVSVAADDDDGDHVAATIRSLRTEYGSALRDVIVGTLGLEHNLTTYLRARWEAQARDAVAAARAHHVDADDAVGAAVGEMGASLLENEATSPADVPPSPNNAAASSSNLARNLASKIASHWTPFSNTARAARINALTSHRHAEELADGVGVHFDASEGTAVGTDEERANRQSGVKRHGRMVVTIVAKRIAESLSDSSNIWLQFLLPLICVALALGLLSIPDPSPDSLSLDPVSLFGAGQEVLYSMCGMPFSTGGPSTFNPPHGGDLTYISAGTGMSSVGISAVLGAQRFSHSAARYGALAWMNPRGYFVSDGTYNATQATSAQSITNVTPVTFTWMADTAMHNTSSSHALPSYLALLHTARLRSHLRTSPAFDTAAITVTSHPFPPGVQAITTEKIVRNLVSVMLLLVPFAFFPANYIAHVVHERDSGFLDVMLASGLSKWHYWLATFIWNMMGFTAFSLGALFIFVFFGSTSIFVGSQDATTTFGLMILYGACATVLAYALSFFFKKPNTAQNAVMMASLLTGFVLVSAWAAMDLVGDTPQTHDAKQRNKQLGEFLRLFPSFALGQGFVKLSMAPVLRFVEQTTASDQAAPSMSLMGLFPVYLIGIFIGEYLSRHRGCRCASDDSGDGVRAADEPTRPAWKHRHVSVDYPAAGLSLKPIVGLRDVNLAVAEGDCCAIIGDNNSGKTTLATVTAGTARTSRGSVVDADGLDAYFDASSLRPNLGVAFDDEAAVDGSLTPYVLLHLMADLRGLRVTDQRQLHVVHVLRDAGLYAVRHRQLKRLGEPTRRRVGVAMALVGYPKRVVLDQPTCGLDPAARSSVFRSLAVANSFGSTVLVTAHSARELPPMFSRFAWLSKAKTVSAHPATGATSARWVVVTAWHAKRPAGLDAVSALRDKVVRPLLEKIPGASDVTDSRTTIPIGFDRCALTTSTNFCVEVPHDTAAEVILDAMHAVRKSANHKGTDVSFRVETVSVPTPRLDESQRTGQFEIAVPVDLPRVE